MATRRSRGAPLIPTQSQRQAARALTVGLVMSVTVYAVEAVAILTAMPAVSRDLHGDNLYGLAFATYMGATVIALVIAGHQADRYGPGRPFLASAALFAAGLIIAGSAPSMTVVVIARAIQGLGGGGLATIAYVGVGRGYPPDRQSRVFAYISTAWVVPGLLAPVVAGYVAEHWSWRYVFFGVLPFVVVALILTFPALHALGPPAESSARRLRDRFKRLVPHGTWRAAPGLPATVMARFCISYGFFGADTFIPLAATRIHHVSNVKAGLVITGSTLTWTVGSWITSRWSKTAPSRQIVGLGVILLALGVAATTIVAWGSTSLVLVAAVWSIGGLGMGLAFTQSSLYALGHAPGGHEGEVSAQLQVADAIGAALAGGVGGLIVALYGDRALTSAIVTLYLIAIVVAASGRLAANRLTNGHRAAATA